MRIHLQSDVIVHVKQKSPFLLLRTEDWIMASLSFVLNQKSN